MLVIILPGRFNFFFRSPELYARGPALVGDYCAWTPPVVE